MSSSTMEGNSIKPWEIREAYRNGQNLMKLLRERVSSACNDEQIIELSYDLQSGSYIEHVSTPTGKQHRETFARHLSEVFANLGPVQSLLEAGVGEATTLWHLINALKEKPEHIHGFDLCWSRVACGARWLSEQSPRFDIALSSASLIEMPYMDNSFDVVYTVHAIEPNHGREEAILREFFRVASRHVVLLEPAYEFASPEARARMESHGYCRSLTDAARKAGFEVARQELFEGSCTPMNPTGLWVLTKNASAPAASPQYACPRFRKSLKLMHDCFYSEDSMRAYPVIGGIPCLRSNSGIVASKLAELADT